MRQDFPDLNEQIVAAVQQIRATGYNGCPEVALIFGSGLGEIAEGFSVELEIPYGEIPGFATTTVSNHKGSLLLGKLGQREIVAMNGRLHYYEGYSMRQVALPTRVMQALGAKVLMVSNIAGGVNPEFRQGDVIVLTDHVNLMWDNPLMGPNDEHLGPRYPDLMEPYSRRLIKLVEQQAMKLGVRVPRGVYYALTGPTYETPAELRMIRKMGGDLVGMSTVPEVMTAVHGGMEVLGLSLVSNECFPECLKTIDQGQLLSTASRGARVMFQLFKGVLEQEDF